LTIRWPLPSATDSPPRGAPAGLLARLRLRTAGVISDDGDSFVTLLCRDESGRQVVLKYVASRSPDAFRRLNNEALLLKHLSRREPLRLLPHRDDGPGYLLTDYDAGQLLRPDRLDDDAVVPAVADALIEFQTDQVDVRICGVKDREHLATYYLKVLLKHILHAWPAHLTALEAGRAIGILTAALPAILGRRVICHGDFQPTNLLFHSQDQSVTLTDLEGFMSRNHPLFDVLALFTMNDQPLARWGWQRRFFQHYLARAGERLPLDPGSRTFQDAYRGLLVFFLVYRLNEARIALSNTSYFDGLGKAAFVRRRLGDLLRARRGAWRDEHMEAALRVRRENLRCALSGTGFREHLDTMLAPA
jgi:hypothetical protein